MSMDFKRLFTGLGAAYVNPTEKGILSKEEPEMRLKFYKVLETRMILDKVKTTDT